MYVRVSFFYMPFTLQFCLMTKLSLHNLLAYKHPICQTPQCCRQLDVSLKRCFRERKMKSIVFPLVKGSNAHQKLLGQFLSG